MRFLPTRVHALLDYSTGLLLIALPFLLGLTRGSSETWGAEAWIPIALGSAAIVYSLLTNYELGLLRILPMPVHLMLDAGSGVLLAASPWLFGFADRIYLPHLILGFLEISASLITRTVPSTQKSRSSATR